MENDIKEYLNQFKTETLELIVRIKWCWKKGGPRFDEIENCYKARARFDMALNVKTGELLDAGIAFYWLEWLAPKKRFGFPYGYKFREGKLYRVLVREKTSEKDDKYNAYYIEQVLEKNVKEPLLDPLNSFEFRFEEQTTDMLVLIKKNIFASTKNNYRTPGAVFIASIDLETNELNQSPGTLTWIEKKKSAKLKYNFKELEAYHIKARKNKNIDNSYMVQDVIKKVTDDRLEKIKEEYTKPVIINDSLGRFELDRKYNRFEGKIDFLGEMCNVYLEVEEGELTADMGLNKLREIYQNLEKWDTDVKEYVSNELLELANDWLEGEGEILKEEFLQRIGIPDITIESDGVIRFMFDSDGIFSDHAIEVEINKNGEFINADIVG